MEEGFIRLIERSIRDNWDLNALTDFNGVTLQYKGLARKIEKIHILFQSSGIERGDRIAVCGRNSVNWCVSFLATVTYGAVIVPILHDFKADNIHNIVNHSGSRLFFVADQVWENLNEESMPDLEGIVSLNDSRIIFSRSGRLNGAFDHLNELFGKEYPFKFLPESISYQSEDPEDVAIINYTSGTTGFSKGVMLPYRSILSNILQCREKIGLKAGDDVVSILPLGHVFGMTVDFLYGITHGVHLWFLSRSPSPRLIMEMFPLIKPKVIACVPLVLEKIIKKNILPRVDNKIGRLLLRLPIINDKIKEYARHEAMSAFGGNFYEIIIGGAPFNEDVEKFLKLIGFPYTVAYGMTECGPLITISREEEYMTRSCGKAAPGMQLKVDSSNPLEISGELMCKGPNLMLGYYKNPEETAKIIDSDGWLRTGDMVTMDAHGNVFIKGRCKNMLLGTSGQNIYPEEIESKINSLPVVNESLVIMKDGKLVALIYPDYSMITSGDGVVKESERLQIIEDSLKDVNSSLPSYSQISRVVIWGEEFEKTAKKSIKRYLYQNVNV